MSLVIDGTGLAPTDASAIRAMVEPWTKACVERNWDRLLSMCTDDIIFLDSAPRQRGGCGRGYGTRC
jgi:ketosteroid isomerase-like protein